MKSVFERVRVIFETFEKLGFSVEPKLRVGELIFGGVMVALGTLILLGAPGFLLDEGHPVVARIFATFVLCMLFALCTLTCWATALVLFGRETVVLEMTHVRLGWSLGFLKHERAFRINHCSNFRVNIQKGGKGLVTRTFRFDTPNASIRTHKALTKTEAEFLIAKVNNWLSQHPDLGVGP
jgi:hypothetical protein